MLESVTDALDLIESQFPRLEEQLEKALVVLIEDLIEAGYAPSESVKEALKSLEIAVTEATEENLADDDEHISTDSPLLPEDEDDEDEEEVADDTVAKVDEDDDDTE